MDAAHQCPCLRTRPMTYGACFESCQSTAGYICEKQIKQSKFPP